MASAMFSQVRKAAAVLSTSTTGHSELGMILYHEKLVAENIQKLSISMSEACISKTKWMKKEDPVYIAFFQKLQEVEFFYGRVMQEFAEQYESHRRSYKHILKGEQMLDEARKQEESLNSKVVKLRKSAETVRKKNDAKKIESSEMALARAMSLHEAQRSDLQQREDNHGLFKHSKLKEAMMTLNNASKSYLEKSQIIMDAEQKLINIFLNPAWGTLNQQDKLADAVAEATSVVNGAADALGFQRPSTEPVPEDMIEAIYQPLPFNDSDSSDSSPCSSFKQGKDRPLPPVPMQRSPGQASSTEPGIYATPYQHDIESSIPVPQGMVKLDPTASSEYLDLIPAGSKQARQYTQLMNEDRKTQSSPQGVLPGMVQPSAEDEDDLSDYEFVTTQHRRPPPGSHQPVPFSPGSNHTAAQLYDNHDNTSSKNPTAAKSASASANAFTAELKTKLSRKS